MIISHSHRFTFVHIHKAGGTSIETALDPYLSWNDLILGSSALGQGINKAYRLRHGLHKHSSVAEIQEICGSVYVDEYFLFAFVRHPIDRICSLYNFVGSSIQRLEEKLDVDLRSVNAVRMAKAAKRAPALKWPATRAFLVSPSFSEFIRDENLELDPGFHAQFSRLNCPITKKMKGEAYRLEDGGKSLSKIGERLGLDIELLHENKSKVVLIERDKMGAEDRRYLEEKFSVDFAAFGY